MTGRELSSNLILEVSKIHFYLITYFPLDDLMIYMREFAKKCYWYLLGVIVFQFFMLYFRDIGFLPLWTLIEYMQLCAFIPLYNFRLIPYLYDTFKPFLVSHLVLSNKAYILTDMEDDYFNINYDYYWLNVAKLA